MRPYVLSLVAVLLLGAAPPAATADPRQEAEQLTQSNEALRRLAELASGDAFYLVLDLSRPALRLMLRGVVLLDYPVTTVEFAQPRRFFLADAPPEDWQARPWTGGHLDPSRMSDRLEVQVPPPGEEPKTFVPPEPHERFPVPARYFIRYDGGRALEFLHDAGARHLWWEDVKAALRGDRDSLRLRIGLRPEDADVFYRAVPPETKFLLLGSAAS
ncbi:MAG TPA: hypothetical protein VJS92_02485 [Candidatus Polarisedimenticolaceae bacterium]|nr:hypothetical protein [Candidatus Polarisedimenticolaceae bacterium]